jgi:hypothetical protein
MWIAYSNQTSQHTLHYNVQYIKIENVYSVHTPGMFGHAQVFIALSIHSDRLKKVITPLNKIMF